MTTEGIVRGESRNMEFKAMLPKDSEKYMKTIIAFANTQGGKLVIGIDDLIISRSVKRSVLCLREQTEAFFLKNHLDEGLTRNRSDHYRKSAESIKHLLGICQAYINISEPPVW